MYSYKITLPSGGYKMVTYQTAEDKMLIANAFVAEWENYCDDNWISSNHEDRFCAENNVKRFLESVSNFLLRGDSEDVITPYKEKRNAESEVLIPDNHDGLVIGVPIEVVQAVDTAPSAFLGKKHITKKDVPTDTTFNRIEKAKRDNPSLKISICAVDTEGGFKYGKQQYAISKDISQYRGRDTKSGIRYDMDRVLCGVCDDGQVIFLDQYGVRLDNINVKRVNDSSDNSKTYCYAGEDGETTTATGKSKGF